VIAIDGAIGTLVTKYLLWAKMANIIALLVRELTIDNIEDRAVVGWLMGFGLNLAALP